MGIMPEFLASEMLGERLIEVADRLVTADKVVPGTMANYSFSVDGTEFEVSVRVKRPALAKARGEQA